MRHAQRIFEVKLWVVDVNLDGPLHDGLLRHMQTSGSDDGLHPLGQLNPVKSIRLASPRQYVEDLSDNALRRVEFLFAGVATREQVATGGRSHRVIANQKAQEDVGVDEPHI